MSVVARTLGVSRSNLHDRLKAASFLKSHATLWLAQRHFRNLVVVGKPRVALRALTHRCHSCYMPSRLAYRNLGLAIPK